MAAARYGLDHSFPKLPIKPLASALTSEVRIYYVEKQTRRKTDTERQGEPGLRFLLPKAGEEGVSREKRKQGERRKARESSQGRC